MSGKQKPHSPAPPGRNPTAMAAWFLDVMESTLADVESMAGDRNCGYRITDEAHPWHETWKRLETAILDAQEETGDAMVQQGGCDGRAKGRGFGRSTTRHKGICRHN